MCSLTGQCFSIALLRQSIDYEIRLPLITAGLLGVPLGTVLLNCCDHHLVRITLGGLIATSALWGLLHRPAPTPLPSSFMSQGARRSLGWSDWWVGRCILCGAGDLVWSSRVEQAAAGNHSALYHRNANGFVGLASVLRSLRPPSCTPICVLSAPAACRGGHRSCRVPCPIVEHRDTACDVCRCGLGYRIARCIRPRKLNRPRRL